MENTKTSTSTDIEAMTSVNEESTMESLYNEFYADMQDGEEEEYQIDANSTKYDPNVLRPKIVKARILTWTRKEILETSMGEVRDRVPLDSNEGENLDDMPGIFYRGIFGRSKESYSKNKVTAYKKEEQKRMSNWGHIKLPIPIVRPGLVEKRFLQKIIGAEKADVLKEVVSWNAYIARPKPSLCMNATDRNGDPISSTEKAIDIVDDFIEANKQNLKVAKSRNLINVVALSNAKRGKYRGASTAKEEKLIIISKDLFKADADKNFGDLRIKDKWKERFVLLPGSYAIMELLSDIDLDVEITHLEYLIKGLTKQNENIIQGNSGTQSNNSIAKNNEIIAKLSSRLELLVGLKKQDILPTELVTDVIPIQPAHWRDRTKMVTAGVVKYTQDGINYMYNSIIEESENIKGIIGDSGITFEDLRDYKTYDDRRMTSVINALQSLNLDSSVETKMRKIQNNLYDYLMSYKEIDAGKLGKVRSLLKRTAGKTDNNRGFVLGKRIDYTARSVITVDQTLNLDEIGVPYDILKVHFRDELIKALTAKSISLADAKEYIEHLGERYDNPVKKSNKRNWTSISYTKSSSQSIENEIYNCLVEILKTRRYLAIRYPSLHKWNELGYRIKIVFDQTIHLNPLLCGGYNADFDGDQMSLFLASLPESIKEIDEILLPIKNDMDANGNPTMEPGQDMIMGLYILTLKPKKAEFDKLPIVKKYANIKDIYKDLELGEIDLHDKIEFANTHYKNSMFRDKYYFDTMDKITYRGDFSAIQGIDKDDEEVAIQGTDYACAGLSTLDFSDQLLPTESLPETIQQARRTIVSTVGRIIFNTFIPQDLGFTKRVETGDTTADAYNPANFALEWDTDEPAVGGKHLGAILKKVSISYNSDINGYVRDLFKSQGYKYVSESGISISLEDINTVTGRDEAIEEGWKLVEANKLKYVGEELRKANIQVWKDIDATLTKRMMEELPDDNPIKMMALSGARGKVTQIKQMNTIRGIMMDASNREMDTPILKNFMDGLDPVAFTVSSFGACKGIMDRSTKTAETGDLARHLTYGLATAIVGDGDCGDTEGILLKGYYVGGIIPEVIDKGKYVPIKDEIEGKNPIYDIIDKNTGDVIFEADKPVHPTYYNNYEERLEKLQEQYDKEGVRVRSIHTCKSPTGYCARCAGYFFAKHAHSKVGDTIGQVAAHTVSERATQLTMRTFHTGGVAEGDISAGFGQIKRTIINGKVTNPAIERRIIPELMNITPEVIQEGLDAHKELVQLLSKPQVRKATLSETINGIVYDNMTMLNFGFVHEDLFHELYDAYYHEVRDAYHLNDIKIKPIHYELIAKQAIGNMRIVYSKDSVYRAGNIIKATALVKENIKLAYEGKSPILAVPTLTGFKQLVMDKNNPLTALMFQRAQEVLIQCSLIGAEDSLTSPIAALALGNTLPVGDGRKYYKEQIEKELNAPPVLMSDVVKGFDPTRIDEVVSDVIARMPEEKPIPFDEETKVLDNSTHEEVEPEKVLGWVQEDEVIETEEEISNEETIGDVKGF